MKLVLTGTGTSHGVPVIGCNCKVCTSTDPRDNRMRCGAWIFEPASILIDVGPEFRLQAIRHGIRNLDAVLITHSHADHLHGIDDLRVFSHTRSFDGGNVPKDNETKGDGLRIYSTSKSTRDIIHRFDYIFKPVKEGGGKPKIKMDSIEQFSEKNPLVVKGVEIVPVMLKHGSLDDAGYMFTQTYGGKKHSIAYLTDCSFIDENSFALLERNRENLECLVIDALREKMHSTHFSFDQALEAADRIGARNTYLIHMSHDLSHVEIERYVDDRIEKYPNLAKARKSGGYVGPAWDGLVLETE